MPQFLDRNDRRIVIGDSGLDVEATHDGRTIGHIKFDEFDGVTVLWDMNVLPAYRRAGIATAMMRHAVALHGPDFRKPSFRAQGGSHAAAHTYYTEEGAALVRHCIQIGLLTAENASANGSEDSDDP